MAYVEVCADEKATTASAVLRRAVAWFADSGVHVERALPDNGSCDRSDRWKATCADLRVTPKRTLADG